MIHLLRTRNITFSTPFFESKTHLDHLPFHFEKSLNKHVNIYYAVEISCQILMQQQQKKNSQL